MNCPICGTKLSDSFGLFCPNEECCYVSEMPTIANEEGVIPLLYENGKIIKWIKVDEFNDKFWHLNGVLHREDGPAVEYYDDGSKEWHLNGKLHRKDGPAIEYADGTNKWYLNGLRHRIGGPAVEFSNGDKYWYLNGKRHREDGPAVECSDGTKYWYLNGKRHREDGSAVEYQNGELLVFKWRIASKK